MDGESICACEERLVATGGGMLLSSDLLLDLEPVPGKCQRCSHPMQDALAEQIQLGAAIAEAFEELHPTNLPFTRAGAPGSSERSEDRIGILAKTPGERLERGQVRGFGLVEPWLECADIALGHEDVKTAFEPVSLGQERVGLQETFQSVPFSLGQAPSRLQEQPCKLGRGDG